MKIPLLDLKAQYETIREDVRSAVDAVFESQYFILGENVRRLEELISGYCGCRHAIGVASGTDALLLGLKALGVGPGDAVLTTSFTFFATAGAIHNLGATPVFVDVDPVNLNLDPAKLLEFLAGRSDVRSHRALRDAAGGRGPTLKTIVPVHLYGQMAPMAEILHCARTYGLTVLEDAAQAIGASQVSDSATAPAGAVSSQPKAGTLGDAGTLSFFPSKNLGAAGDAGMVLTNRDDLAEQVHLLRVHGSRPKYVHHIVGFNSRLDELQAAVLVAKFPYLEGWSSTREQNAAYYRQGLKDAGLGAFCRLPTAAPGNRHIYHQFVVRVPQRDELRAFLAEQGVATETYYPIPLHLQECFAYLGYRSGDLPETERAALDTLALPVYPELTRTQMDYVIESISRFYGRGSARGDLVRPASA